MKHYLFEDLETGEAFLVGAHKSSEAYDIATKYFANPQYIEQVSEETAEASGLDEF